MRSWSYELDRWRLRRRRRRVAALLACLGGAVVAAAIIVVSGDANAIMVAGGNAHARSSPASHGQIAPALEARIGRETQGRLTTVHFYSRALHQQADYLVYLPAGYSPRRRLPVFYMLHGMPGKPVAFTVNADVEVKLQRLIDSWRVAPMVLVFPDGRIDGRVASDSEWANTPSGEYESYVTDVVSDVDHRYATLACRQERAIAGLSAGAYGAANVGLHQDPTFGLVQVWSGYFVQTRTGVFAHADRATMAYNSPRDYVRTMRRMLRRDPLRAFLYAGRDESDHAQVPAMAAALRAQGADATWAIYPGGHSWNEWTPHVDQMLAMADRDFAHPLAGAPAGCR